jgi:hypothetical protein
MRNVVVVSPDGDGSATDLDLVYAQRFANAINEAIAAVGKQVQATEKIDAMTVELALLAVHANFLNEIAPNPLEAAEGAGEELRRLVAARSREHRAYPRGSRRVEAQEVSQANAFGDLSEKALVLMVELWLILMTLPWTAMRAVDEQLTILLRKQFVR